MCCSPWGRKESDTTGRLKNNNMLKVGKDSDRAGGGRFKAPPEQTPD